MMANTILYIGSAEDPHIQEVDKHVKAMDSEVRVVLFNPGCESHLIEITAGKLGPSCTIVLDDERITAESISSVWYRWAPAVLSADQGMQDPRDLQEFIAKDFSSKEWNSVISSLASYLPHARWVNPVAAEEMMHCKPHQLKLAQQVGLTLPQTTITNNPAAVGELFEQVDHGRVIFKTLTRLSLPPDKILFTNEVTKEFPSVSQSNITQCPAIYQELIERESDLRITVVGREVFVARIASQTLDEKKDRLDWRRCQDRNELYSKVQISESFKERLLEFHEKSGLVFAAYDFLERGDDVIFLECNPGGLAAYLWLEHFLGLNVSEHIARYLLGIDAAVTS